MSPTCSSFSSTEPKLEEFTLMATRDQRTRTRFGENKYTNKKSNSRLLSASTARVDIKL